MNYRITNQRALRREFWQTFPTLRRGRITDYAGTGKMHVTDTRCAWCDWLDQLSKNGDISQHLAENATLSNGPLRRGSKNCSTIEMRIQT